MPSSNVKLLFLTTQWPETIKAEWPLYQNYTLPQIMKERGADVSIISWLDESLTCEKIATFDIVTFLWCNQYDQYPQEFEIFLRQRLSAAQSLSPSLAIMNSTTIILWNFDKAVYLRQLRMAGFNVPKTAYIDDVTSLTNVGALASQVSELATTVSGSHGSVVIKPSISSSSKQTYMMINPSAMSSQDIDYLSNVYRIGTDGSLMIQAFEPGIVNGEYSFVYVAESFAFAIPKVPLKGEFRCQPEFGRSTTEMSLDDIPSQIKRVAEDVVRFIQTTVGELMYCRVDGVVRDTGEFVLMEVEAIEPDFYMEVSSNDRAKEMLYATLMTGRV